MPLQCTSFAHAATRPQPMVEQNGCAPVFHLCDGLAVAQGHKGRPPIAHHPSSPITIVTQINK
jgi:hypothetical protein